MLLAAAERRIGLADRLAGLMADPRNPLFVTHSVADILRARMLAIACGYEDADDLDHLRTDPGFKLACGRLPDSRRDLCSQPTVSRWENAPTLREAVLSDQHRAALARAIEDGPIPAVHGVVRWRIIDLCQWLRDEFEVTVSKQTLGRELRALGYRKLSAGPRHHAQAAGAIEAFKKSSRRSSTRSGARKVLSAAA